MTRRIALACVALVAALAWAPSATGAADDVVEYVALGDSYTSGPLVLPHDQQWVPQDCGQSARNYPHLVALELGDALGAFKDVSCGGATIDDFFAPQDAFVNGTAAPQIDALHPGVDVVTIGIGGNDVGFVSLALDCMRFQPPPLGDPPCTPDYKHDGIDEIAQKIAATAIELGVAIDRLRAKAPNAAMLIVNYPTALPDDAVACWPYLPILQEDMPYLVEKFKEMNEMLRSVAAAKGATYVDIYTSSIGHDACKPPGLAWINGGVLVPPSFPAHPNDLSYLNSGPIVAQAIRRALLAQAATTTTTPAPAGATPSRPGGEILPRTGDDAALPLGLGAATVTTLALRRRRGGRRA